MANFHKLMARIGWSDAELSHRLSVRPAAVRDWRTGRREVPPNLLDWLRMYAEAIDRLPPLPKDWTRSRRPFRLVFLLQHPLADLTPISRACCSNRE
jgi:hypothetical protein